MAAAWCTTWRRIIACGPAIRGKCTSPTSRARVACWTRPNSAGVERVVYTSTVGCIGVPHGWRGRRRTPGEHLEQMQGPYKRSKFLAEQVAMEFAEKGFPVVIVNPTAPVGDHDFKPTPTGRIVVDFVRGAMPAFVDTGLNMVDVGRGAGPSGGMRPRNTRRALHSGLGEPDASADSWTFAGILGRPAPSVQIPYAVAYASGVASTAWAGVTGKEPRAPLDAVRMSRKKRCGCVTTRPRGRWGIPRGPAADALRRAVVWFQENGYC